MGEQPYTPKGKAVDCSILSFGKNLSNNSFLRLIRDEDRRVNESKAQEILATKENPRLKEQENSTGICEELRQIKLKEFREEKRRQQLYENSHELRKLQAQIRSALVSKQVMEQKEYQETKNKNLIKERQKETEQWNTEHQRLKELEAKEELAEIKKKAALRADLLKQMAEMRQRGADEYKLILKDREEMLKKMENLEAEDLVKATEKQRYRQRCREEMEESHRNKMLQKQLAKEQAAFDSNEGFRLMEKREEMKKQLERERKRLQAERQALSERIGKQLADLKDERKNRETLLLSLLIEERKANEDARDRRNLEKRIETRMKLRKELDMYIYQIQPEKKALKQREDREIQAEQQRFLNEKDNEERQKDLKRKEMMVKHRLATLEMIEDTRQRRAQDTLERIQDFEYLLAKQREKYLTEIYYYYYYNY